MAESKRAEAPMYPAMTPGSPERACPRASVSPQTVAYSSKPADFSSLISTAALWSLSWRTRKSRPWMVV